MIIRFPKKARETFFLDHLRATILGTFLIALICYFFIDIPLAKYFASSPKALIAAAEFFSALINSKYQLFIWPALFFLFRFIYKKEQLGNRCLLILLSISIANIFTELLASLLGRARPELLFTQGLYGFNFLSASNPFSSFPSGHACTIGALCGAFACFYPRLWLPLFFLSLILAFTRVILTVHFFSDILVGIAIGFIVAQWIFKVMKKEHISFLWRYHGTPF